MNTVLELRQCSSTLQKSFNDLEVLEKAKYLRREGVKGNYRYIYKEATPKGSLKQRQLEIVKKHNPAKDDYHTWIRKEEDILTAHEAFKEAIEDGEDIYFDFTVNDMKDALRTGRVTLYSSYPIKEGIFVTPSEMNAKDYAGNSRIYSKTVKITDVAWIDEGQGQYVPS
jgi:hypothetical protein